jgi:hypothetical protein
VRAWGLRGGYDGGRFNSEVMATAPSTQAAATQEGQTKLAEDKGRARAAEDIRAGKPHIAYYGKPWSAGRPLIDESSGLRVEIVEGCVVTGEFVAETDAYNAAMREWAKLRAGSATGPATRGAAGK